MSNVHTIQLSGGNANAIDEALLEALTDGLRSALDTGKTAVVLTGCDRFFSAGLNLKTLPETREGMASFVARFEEANIEMLRFPLPVVAAVNGHAIAGGCVLACAADLRIGASGTHKLGVSEVTLGIVFPASAFEIMRHTLTPSFVPEVLLSGKLLSPEEARLAGILHHVVAPEELLATATARAEELGSKPRHAFHHSKLALRAPMFERIEKTQEAAREAFLETWFSPEVVERRKAMLG